MNENKKYEIIKNIPLPTIECVDVVFGSKPVLYGTLNVSEHNDIKLIIDKFEKLNLKYQFQRDLNSIFDEEHESRDLQLNFAVGNDYDLVDKFLEHENKNNHKEMGELLGYPVCCTNQFHDYFPKDNNKWTGSKIANYLPYRLNGVKKYPFYTNRLLRYSEYNSLLYHFPCSFNCKESIKIAERRYRILKNLDEKRAKEMKKHMSSLFVFCINESNDGYYEEVIDLVYFSDYNFKNDEIMVKSGVKKGSKTTNQKFFDRFKNINKIEIESYDKFTIDNNELKENNIGLILFE